MNMLRLAGAASRKIAFYGLDILLPAFGIPKALGYLAALLLVYWIGNYVYVAIR
jgi:hypothetical protein